MTNLAKWETYTPYGIGLEDFFRRLDHMHDTRSNFPPYNIVKQDENNHFIEIALAGYRKNDLEVSVEKHTLTVSGKNEEDIREYTYKGIAQRSFTKSWNLGDDVKVDCVTHDNGMLRVYLRREVPEDQKKKILPIK
ncbi:small heat shock protein [Synechococcus phage S-CRM01]|uniref:Hsp20 heat shock protein n=1 Tax=Synechococcus phage S-CRM01 TaxID=1026955 RepID=UPI000209E3E2|nr:Hsp20 heat shock protein [Synechococcus phage S-CRM01]AEC53091.1 small heat shock protein [Synechococcus phage S-CRM01]